MVYKILVEKREMQMAIPCELPEVAPQPPPTKVGAEKIVLDAMPLLFIIMNDT
jgi:hypothetical protein